MPKDFEASAASLKDLTLLAEEHPSDVTTNVAVAAAVQIIAKHGQENLSLSFAIYESLKTIVERHATKQNIIVLGSSAYNLLNYCLQEQIKDSIDDFFYGDVYLLAAKYDIPELWFFVEMSISRILQFPGIVDQARSEIYIDMFKKLLKTYEHHPF